MTSLHPTHFSDKALPKFVCTVTKGCVHIGCSVGHHHQSWRQLRLSLEMYLSLLCPSTEWKHGVVSESGPAMLRMYEREDYSGVDLSGSVSCHSANEVLIQDNRLLDGPMLFPDQPWVTALSCKERRAEETRARDGARKMSHLPLGSPSFKGGCFLAFKYHTPVLSHQVEIRI